MIFIRKLKAPSVLIPLAGFVFCVILVGSLNLTPMLTKKDGYVWSPLNSSQYKATDSYYYAAWMMEVVEGECPPVNPSARDGSGAYTVEMFKVVSVVLSAFPSLFLSDPRYIFFVSYTIFPGIIFLLSYFISFRFTKSPWSSFAVGIIGLFYYLAAISYLDGHISSFRLFTYPFHLMTLAGNDLEYLNSNFRFINTSVSACILLALFLGMLRLQEKQTWGRFAVALMLCLAISFTYLPMMVLSYMFLFGFCIIYIIRDERKLFRCYFSLGVCVVTFLLSIGYLDMMGEYRENTHFLNSIFIHAGQDAEQNVILWSEVLWSLVTNKYLLLWAIALFCARRIEVLRDWMLIFVVVGLLLSIVFTVTQNSLYSIRFSQRAYGQPFVVFAVTAMIISMKRLWEKAGYMRADSARRVGRLVCIATIAGLVFFPAFGFARYAMKNTQSLAYYIPQGQWDAFNWLRNNSEKNSVVLAIDWSDVYLVPSYTRNDLYFGNYILDNRTTHDEIARYLIAWRLLGLPRADLEEMVSESVKSYKLLITTLQHNQFPSRKTFESTSFLHGLMYYPYIGGIDGREPGTPDFLRYIMKSYDKTNLAKSLESTRCDYILISDYYWNRATSLSGSKTFRLVYENNVRRIYKVERT